MTTPTPSSEIAGGLALVASAFAALLFVNMGGSALYAHLLEMPLTLGLSPFSLTKTAHHWVNDGLMALFFVVVGIEINRELRTGSLKTLRQAAVPALAAIGGFVVPALVFLAFTWGNPTHMHGWSIPAATDIAFAVALITALRAYVPPSLRIFLLALAVVDDLLAIAVIALFYTAELVWLNLFLAGVGACVMLAKRRLGLQTVWFYAVVGIFMWACVLQSGVHATVAGVLVGLLLPQQGGKGKASPAEVVEHTLQPWVRWLVLPLFAFANVGVNLTGLTWQTALTPLTLAIAMGLFLGKQLGVFGTVYVLEKTLSLPRPAHASWKQIYGVATLCGIGFTMSLFIGALALPSAFQDNIRLGVLLGSLLSALLTVIILITPVRRKI